MDTDVLGGTFAAGADVLPPDVVLEVVENVVRRHGPDGPFDVIDLERTACPLLGSSAETDARCSDPSEEMTDGNSIGRLGYLPSAGAFLYGIGTETRGTWVVAVDGERAVRITHSLQYGDATPTITAGPEGDLLLARMDRREANQANRCAPIAGNPARSPRGAACDGHARASLCPMMSARASRPEWGAGWRSPEATARLNAGLDYCWRFFVGEAEAQKAVRKLVDILEREGVPYAIIGALALNEYGHRRVTVDVDLVMREEDLQAFKARWLGRGYAEREPGTGKLLDTEHGVNVDVLSTGRFPGDDKPKPIAFPDPATTAVRGAPFAMLPIERWIELKLASGMVAPHRRKDLTDVQELVRSAGLDRELSEGLHPWVRDKFLEIWQEVADGDATDPYS